MLPKNELMQLHVDIGLLLISKGGRASRHMVNEIFAFAVSHINMALPDGSSNGQTIEFTPSQRIVFAKLNLKGGQKRGKLDFSLAKVHLKAAVSFLPENSWIDHYDLSLQIYEEYANVSMSFCFQCSATLLISHFSLPLVAFHFALWHEKVLFVTRSLDKLQSHVEIILANAKCTGDKIKAHELIISALTLQGSTAEALDHAKSVLDTLGFPFPSSGTIETAREVAQTLSTTVMAITPDQLRTFPLMTDEVPLQAMKIMSAVHMTFSFSRPFMFHMMACQMMQLTLKHGLCVQSAEAFANCGYCMNSLFHNYELGYRMGKLSLMILDRFKATTMVAKVGLVVYGFLSVWIEPIQATIEGLQSNVVTGQASGNFDSSLYDRVVVNRKRLLAGYNLQDLQNSLLRLCQDMVRIACLVIPASVLWLNCNIFLSPSVGA